MLLEIALCSKRTQHCSLSWPLSYPSSFPWLPGSLTDVGGIGGYGQVFGEVAVLLFGWDAVTLRDLKAQWEKLLAGLGVLNSNPRTL